MKKRTLLIQFGLVGLVFSTAHSAVIAADPFTDGGFNGTEDPGDPNDVAWATSGTAISISGTAPLPGTGNALQITSTGLGLVRASLPTTSTLTLEIGQTITLSMNLLFYAAAPNTQPGGLRIGLLSSAGYGTGIAIGTGDDNSLRITHDSVAGGTGNADMFGGTGNQNVDYNGTGDSNSKIADAVGVSGLGTDITTISLSITRTSDTVMNISGTVNGVTVSAVDTNNSSASDYIYDFSGGYIGLKSGNHGSPYKIDDVVVSVIPEPSSALLGALGVLALLRRRR